VSQASVATPAVRFPALRIPEYRLYWGTSTIAMIGDNIEHVIGYWLLWELTHSPFWLGYAVFAHWFPFIIFSLHSGAWADRFDNRRLLQVSQALYVFCSGTLGLLAVTGQLQLWHMIVILLVHGFSGVVNMPSSQVLIHDLVGKEDLPNALSLSAASRNVAWFMGPAVGGLLMWAFGPGGGLLANLLIYIPFTVALFYLNPPRASAPVPQATGWEGIKEGLRYVRDTPVILGLTLLSAIPAGIVGFAFQALMPALSADLGTGQQGYSALLSANGVGAIGGAVILGYVGRLGGKGMLVVAFTLIWGVLLFLFSLSPWFLLSFGIMLLVGAASIVSNAMSQTLVQALSPDDKRGRVMGVYALVVHGPRVISGLLLGGLASLIGAHVALGLLSLVVVVAVAALAAALPTVRALD
jgi:MFS family permease